MQVQYMNFLKTNKNGFSGEKIINKKISTLRIIYDLKSFNFIKTSFVVWLHDKNLSIGIFFFKRINTISAHLLYA